MNKLKLAALGVVAASVAMPGISAMANDDTSGTDTSGTDTPAAATLEVADFRTVTTFVPTFTPAEPNCSITIPDGVHDILGRISGEGTPEASLEIEKAFSVELDGDYIRKFEIEYAGTTVLETDANGDTSVTTIAPDQMTFSMGLQSQDTAITDAYTDGENFFEFSKAHDGNLEFLVDKLTLKAVDSAALVLSHDNAYTNEFNFKCYTE